MRIAYYADDGTEFETEEECNKYERRLHDLMDEHQLNSLHAYDDNGHAIDFSGCDLEDLEDAFQHISYIEFDNEKVIEIFLEQARYYGMCEIDDDLRRPLVAGEHYFYDWDEDMWTCIEDRQKELDKVASVFK